MRGMKLLGFTAGLLLGALAGSAPAIAQQPIVIKFSHVVAADTPKGKAAQRFKQLVEASTQGQVRVEVYANSTLFGDVEEFDALRRGSVQMLAPSLSKFAPLGVREFELFDLPYLFADYGALHRVTEGPIGTSLLKKLEGRGIVGLAYWDNGFKVFTSDRPVRSPGDMKGLKLRVQSSRVLVDEIKALGAIPEILAFSEVYQALKRGRVDGAENVPSNIYSQRHNEVQKHLALTYHGYLGYAVIVARPFWEGLSGEVRAAISAAMQEATRYANEIAQKENEDSLAGIRNAGSTEVVALTDEQRAAWKRTLLVVHKEHAARIGTDLLREVYQQTGFTD